MDTELLEYVMEEYNEHTLLLLSAHTKGTDHFVQCVGGKYDGYFLIATYWGDIEQLKSSQTLESYIDQYGEPKSIEIDNESSIIIRFGYDY